MNSNDGGLRAILIGGTSHTGKSTLARGLADALGWQYLSTDQLARHPGRPWGDAVPAVVKDYYRTADPDELVNDVMDHYRGNVWPIVQAIVASRIRNHWDAAIVLEGSAILPQTFVEAGLERTHAVWLTGADATIESRIRRSSHLADAPPDDQSAIRAFLQRSLAFDRVITRAVDELGLSVASATVPTLNDPLFKTLIASARR